jgi:hypothetical protein
MLYNHCEVSHLIGSVIITPALCVMCSCEKAVASSTAASGTAAAAPTVSFSSVTTVQYDDDDDVITDVLQDEVKHFCLE